MEYSASSIVALKGLDGIKKRPGMYVGDCSSNAATHHLLFEIFDNGVDEALAGHASMVNVVLHEDGSAEIHDNGRGIPVDMHPTEGVPAAEVVFTSLHAGGKFTNSAYKFSGGLHGVGAAVTNALSWWLDVEIKRDGGVWTMRFEEGVLKNPLTKIRNLKKGEETGTTVRFKPCEKYLKDPIFDGESLAARFREIAHLNSGLRVVFEDKRSDRLDDHLYNGGMASFVQSLAENAEMVNEIAHFKGEEEGVEVEVAFAWRVIDAPELCKAYTNNIPQPDGGQHVTGFRTALARILLNHGDKTGLVKKSVKLTADDLREGLVVAMHVHVPDPAFSSQTKEKLISIEAKTAMESVMTQSFARWLDTNPEATKSIISRAVDAADAREAAKKAREMSRLPKSGKRISTAALPEKLSDCSAKDPAVREVYLVEGDSAGGSAKGGRDRETQAILPLRGKILNVERAKPSQILKNAEIDAITKTLGAGIGKNFDASRLRYNKVVIMTDADVDGAHIATLILTFFYRQMPDLIKEGHLYLAAPPLYRVRRKNEGDLYVRTDSELEKHFFDRALAEGQVKFDTTTLKGVKALEQFQPLLNAVDVMLGAIQHIGHKTVADVVLGAKESENLFIGKPLSKVSQKNLTKKLQAALLEDQDAKWEIDINDHQIVAKRNEDGIVETYVLNNDVLQNWRVARLRQGAQACDMLEGTYSIAGDTILGPISLLEHSRLIGSKGTQVSRYKGLGEMNPNELWETTMDPGARSLFRVDMADLEAAENIFTDLMADNVAARRAMIEKMCAGFTNK